MSSLEAKIVVLGSQGVGKTSLVMRYCNGAFNPSKIVSTVGASFMTKRVVDTDTDTVVRLQIWDTAGQERFRSISRLYYRGANACILCYSITDAASFDLIGMWLTELRRNLPPDVILHVVGTKADIVARDPSAREVPFERVIAYVAEHLSPGSTTTPPQTATVPVPTPRHSGSLLFGGGGGGGGAAAGGGGGGSGGGGSGNNSNNVNDPRASSGTVFVQGMEPRSPSSKRSSGFWAMEAGWDACHEISAESGEGVEEVFRVVTRKLVEQNRQQQALALATSPGSLYATGGPGNGGMDASGSGYHGHAAGCFEGHSPRDPNASFRIGRDRRSWLFSPGFSGAGGPPVSQGVDVDGAVEEEDGNAGRKRGGKCC